jgi:hypothetical protein
MTRKLEEMQDLHVIGLLHRHLVVHLGCLGKVTTKIVLPATKFCPPVRIKVMPTEIFRQIEEQK